MYGCNFYLENRNRKEELGKKGRPCMKRDTCRAAPCFLAAEEWRRRFVASNAGDSATKFQLT
jgi:hypothetical protein